MARLLNIFQFVDNEGLPLSGGKLYTYAAGGTTPKTTYKNQSQSSSHTNPIILDANGRPPTNSVIWLLTDSEYRFKLYDSTDSTLYFDIDNIYGSIDPTYEAFQSSNVKFSTGGGIYDDSGNEQLIFTKTASAVNYLNSTNSATGNSVIIETKGDDSNVGLTIQTKGSGAMLLTATGGVKAGKNRLDNAIVYNCFGGLTTVIAADTNHDITIAAGTCADSTNATIMFNSSTLTKQTDAAWAAGTNAGGMPSGVTLTTSTWYHIFLIMNSAGTVVDAGYDTSMTASNLLTASGYTYYRYVSSVLTDSSSNIIPYTQYGNYYLWTTPLLDIDVSNLTTSTTAYALRVPTGFAVRADFNAYVSHGSATRLVQLNTPAAADAIASATATPGASVIGSSTQAGAIRTSILTNTTKQIEASADNSSTILRLVTLGWAVDRNSI